MAQKVTLVIKMDKKCGQKRTPSWTHFSDRRFSDPRWGASEVIRAWEGFRDTLLESSWDILGGYLQAQSGSQGALSMLLFPMPAWIAMHMLVPMRRRADPSAPQRNYGTVIHIINKISRRESLL